MVVRFLAAALGSVAVFAASSAGATCFDGVRNGPESDVDCGGDCPPCARTQWCRIPRDCYSGRCAEYQCEEQLHDPDEPVPRGYVVEQSAADGPAIARTIGWVSLGAGYAGAYVAALTLPGKLSWMYVPVVGPWVKIADSETPYPGLIAVDGFFQTVGAGLVVGGIAMANQQLVRQDAVTAKAHVHVTPVASSSGGGVFVFGDF